MVKGSNIATTMCISGRRFHQALDRTSEKNLFKKGRTVVMTVRWMYKPEDVFDRNPQVIRGPRESIATDHQDEVDQKSLRSSKTVEIARELGWENGQM